MSESRPPSGHLVSLEYLRVLAAFGIVWFHMRTEWDKSIGYAGLYAFALISVFLACGSVKRKEFKSYARDRYIRLLLPWLFWSVFYVVFRLLLGSSLSLRSAGDVLRPEMLLGGGHVVLWYLFFMYVVTMVQYGFLKSTTNFSRAWLSVICFAFSIGLIGGIPLVVEGDRLSYPFAQWFGIAPAILLGLGVGVLFEVPDVRFRQVGLMVMCLVLASILLVKSKHGIDLGVLSLCLGFWGFTGSLIMQLPQSRKIEYLSGLTLGIYVLHPCTMKVLELTAPRMPFPLDVMVVFASTAVLVAILRRFTLIRRFL